ncbi:hypothetical protein SUGI_0089790 [Cryptomeria japonica]|nr:hypothetical protein SUGI_0089790 [Cryptomeria japonica]
MDESCLKWLDAQELAFVIYISFDNIAVKSIEYMEELAMRLEKSEHPFVWVLRMDIAGGMPATLLDGFKERTKDHGVIVKWAPQDVWKIGIDLEGVDVDENLVIKREEIEKGVMRLMEGPQVEEL